MSALRVRAMPVLLALILMIRATFLPTEDLMEAVELLRAAAKKAGCADPRVSMRSLGDDRRIEIEVRCADRKENGG